MSANMSGGGQAGTMAMPKRWPLITQAANRGQDFLKDARLVNAFAELDPDTSEYWVQKRIGFSVANSNLVTAGVGRGMYTWYVPSPIPNPINYAVIGNGANASLFANGVVNGTPLGLVDSGGNWMFTETQGAIRYMVFAGMGLVAGGTLYYVPTGGGPWTQAVLPGGRGNSILGLAYLDGTIYFMDELCQIFGSNLEDPATWTTTNMIPAKKIPGSGVALVRQLAYVIALKTGSMEVFYDGAGPPPGSPLLQIDGATNTFGCLNHDTVQTIDGIVLYVTLSQAANTPQVVRIDNLVPTVVSTPAIERLLSPGQVFSSVFYSFVFKYGGHRFYGISNTTAGITLVYDIDQNKPMGLWYQWTDSAGSYFKMQATGLSGAFQHEFLSATDSNIYLFDGDYLIPTDNGVVTPVDIYTPNEDFGTRRRKTLHRMYIRGDQVTGSYLDIRHSDNDYQKWSVPRRVNLGRKTPYIDDEGTFVKRAYHFRHARPTAFRVRTADLQMDIGTI